MPECWIAETKQRSSRGARAKDTEIDTNDPFRVLGKITVAMDGAAALCICAVLPRLMHAKASRIHYVSPPR